MVKRLRFCIGGFYHETNTFSARPTRIDDFHAYQFAAGDELIAKYAGSNTEMGGMIAEAERQGVTLVPLLFAAAVPSGPINREAFETIIDELVNRLDAAGEIDALLLVLHGAAVADGYPDADGHLVATLRKRIGSAPIGVTLDFHANLGRNLVDAADFVCGYDTYPHVDMGARGAEATRNIVAIARSGQRPHRAFRKLPLVTVPLRQGTSDTPMAEISTALSALEHQSGIVSATITMGFAYADCPNLGAAVLVYAEAQEEADRGADRLAALIWSQREQFRPELVDLDAVARIIADDGPHPIVIVDPADNVGGGSAGDGTTVLAALLEAKSSGTVVVIADPTAVTEADRVGNGGIFEGLVGGKIDGLHGPPVRIRGVVIQVLDASYRHTGSYMTGFVTHMGRTAVVDVDGVLIVLTTQRTMPFDVGHMTAVGIAPIQQRAIVAKSAIAWRAAFGDIAARVITVDTPGVCPANLARLKFETAPRPFWPLDTRVSFP